MELAALADATVLDLDGRAHKLGEYFQERSAVLLFVRHFG